MKKYRFKTMREYELALAHVEQEVTLHHITLQALLSDEYTWTAKHEDGTGKWFQMGSARASAAYGGVVLVREFMPANGHPTQSAHWADTWIRDMSEHRARRGFIGPDDSEGRAYWKCFDELVSIQRRLAA